MSPTVQVYFSLHRNPSKDPYDPTYRGSRGETEGSSVDETGDGLKDRSGGTRADTTEGRTGTCEVQPREGYRECRLKWKRTDRKKIIDTK